MSATQLETIQAPADQEQETVDLDQARAAARFGIIGYESYAAAVMAESERFFQAQQKAS